MGLPLRALYTMHMQVIGKPCVGNLHAHLPGLGSIRLKQGQETGKAECIGARLGDEPCAILLERMEVGHKKREAIC